MTKIGVGVGEDFPMEDRPSGQGGGEGPPGGCGWSQDWDSAEWRARREEWRQQRREWRARHREWRGNFRAEMRARGYGGWYFFPLVPIIVIAFLLTLLVTGLITVIASAPVVVFGLILAGVLYAVHRHHPLHRYAHDYYSPRLADADATPTSGGRTQNGNPPPPNAEN
jgi:hypothetical protein